MRADPPFRSSPGAAEGATLAIEAATPRGSVALVRDGALLAEVLLPAGIQVSASYVPALAELFARAGDVPVARVAVSAGPGSFTGLRVGLAAAKGLCLPSRLPLVPVPTLEALALAAREVPEGAVVCPVLDARKKELYCAAFVFGGGAGELRRLLPDAPLPPSRLLSLLPPEGAVLFLGDGVDACAPLLSEALGPRALLAPPESRYPRAWTVGLLGERIGRGGGDGDSASVLPRYLRRPEAEEAAAAPPLRPPPF